MSRADEPKKAATWVSLRYAEVGGTIPLLSRLSLAR